MPDSSAANREAKRQHETQIAIERARLMQEDKVEQEKRRPTFKMEEPPVAQHPSSIRTAIRICVVLFALGLALVFWPKSATPTAPAATGVEGEAPEIVVEFQHEPGQDVPESDGGAGSDDAAPTNNGSADNSQPAPVN